MKILAFESSCDETAVAVVEDGRKVLSDAILSQADMHALYGGVAGQLLDVFLNFAQANQLAFLTLEVRESNYAAIALYGSRGFRSVGRRKNYYEHPKEDAIIMTREFGEEA